MDSNGQGAADAVGKERQEEGTPSCRSTSPSVGELVLLVLGDGDFSYSYDLARYLKTEAQPKFLSKPLHLVTTGLDSTDALTEKYKDSTFLVKNLKALNDNNDGFRVSVHHGINAVRGDLPPEFRRANHVLFNHPHLGEENATLHARFLCHLFHSVSTVWLVPGSGFFHITLVKGQFDRWKCEEAGKRHGMTLLGKHPFRPPRVSSSYYQHRRHQTGKSFAARAPQGSETFTFVREARESEAKLYFSEADSLFSAQLLDLVTSDAAETLTTDGNQSDEFLCHYCDKSFREERSRRNHVKSVHTEDANRKRKREDDTAFFCNLCMAKDGTGPRVFSSAQALKDHRKAKHLADHPKILPDWHDARGHMESNTGHSVYCEICGASFPNEEEKWSHVKAFIPSDITVDGSNGVPLPFECSYCQKAFRERRAQKQHENFCSLKFKG